MSTKLHRNIAMIDNRRALWAEKNELELVDTVSTQTLVDALLERDLNDSQWVALLDKLGEEI